MKCESEIRAAAMAMEAALNEAAKCCADQDQVQWMKTQFLVLCWVLELEVSPKIVEQALDGMVAIMRNAASN